MSNKSSQGMTNKESFFNLPKKLNTIEFFNFKVYLGFIYQVKNKENDIITSKTNKYPQS